MAVTISPSHDFVKCCAHLDGRLGRCLLELLTGRTSVARVRGVGENRLLVEMVYRRYEAVREHCYEKGEKNRASREMFKGL